MHGKYLHPQDAIIRFEHTKYRGEETQRKVTEEKRGAEGGGADSAIEESRRWAGIEVYRLFCCGYRR